MQDIIIVAIILVIVLLAARYIYKAKKSGKKCIGCPDGGSCSSSGCGCGCGCGGETVAQPTENVENGACCCQSDETK